MTEINVKGVIFGKDKPKIAVPIVGKTIEAVLNEVEHLKTLPCDLVEWRVDLFDQVDQFEVVAKVSHQIAELLPDRPLLLTFRTLKEGGSKEFEATAYYELYRYLLEHGSCDLLDLELFMADEQGVEIIALARAKGVKIIMSNHDFEQTPSQVEIEKRLLMMASKGADICKIAVMPQTAADVLTLLTATNNMKTKTSCPVVSMSMGQLGLVSRMFGEVFGSAITFGAAEQSSAPGQLPVTDLVELLNVASLAK